MGTVFAEGRRKGVLSSAGRVAREIGSPRQGNRLVSAFENEQMTHCPAVGQGIDATDGGNR